MMGQISSIVLKLDVDWLHSRDRLVMRVGPAQPDGDVLDAKDVGDLHRWDEAEAEKETQNATNRTWSQSNNACETNLILFTYFIA